MSVVIETTIGDITVDLYLKERPNTCLNFLKLCRIKYYNLHLFHKVERNFIAQTGDPTSSGRGGESIFSHLYGEQAKYFDSELKPRIKHEKMGTLSMVNNGNNMNGSQFFLTMGENLTYLDEVHTVFGEVVEGFDILLKLNEAICDQNNRPYQDIRITHTVVLHDPYDDPPGLEIPDASPEPTKEMLETDYIAPDEEIDDTKGKDVEEIEEKIKESEAKARATILEMVGDIPDAEVKPPENVLFVCKLNPVTESKDLKVIFSRFGTIVSCEVIKDKTTGESLQYAFIEFEKEEDCENAYFKMDNVLIDDRRIHVDFSQSVSKLNFNQKNKFSKGKSDRTQNFVLKNAKSDGYEMIFDTEGDSKPRNKYVDKNKRSYSDSKKSNHSNYSETYTRRISDSPEKLSHKYEESRSYKKKYRTKHSRSPSPAKSSQKSKRYRSRSPHNYRNSKSYYDTEQKDRMPSYSVKSNKSKHLPRISSSAISHHRKKYTSSDSDSSENFSSKKLAMSSSYSKSTGYHKVYERNIKSKQKSRNRSQSRSPEHSKYKNKSSHIVGSHKHVKQYKKQSSTSEDSSSSESENSKRKSYKSKSSNLHYKHSSREKCFKKDSHRRRSSS